MINYKINYKGKYVLNVETEEIVTSDSEDVLDYFEDQVNTSYNALNEGHIFIKMTNNSKDKVLEVKQGEAFAQGIFLAYGLTVDDDVVDERTGGFGSTNKL